MAEPDALIALLHGPDQPGLVARTAGWIYERGGNILHADQHRDDPANVFFQRIEWEPAGDAATEGEAFCSAMRALGMQVQLAQRSRRARIALLVSKIPHCFLDFLLRSEQGEFRGEVVLALSNHADLQPAAERHGVPFHHIPVSAAQKAEAEAAQLALLREAGVELVVLARYMQVLSAGFLAQVGCPVINIHHSFLPAFAGARPYHHAYRRGVKLIGATAHYATADLDEGPILQQAVARVSHRHTPADLMRIGRDLEKSVLAQAVRWHLEFRVLTYANKTVVFD